jgi:hypothetical protein
MLVSTMQGLGKKQLWKKTGQLPFVSPVRHLSGHWISDYSSLAVPQRYEVLQHMVLPKVSQSLSQPPDSQELVPIVPPVAALFHEMSRHKGSIAMSMLARDDIRTLLRSKDINSLLPVTSSISSSLPTQLRFADKVFQSYLQSSLLCYDSMSLKRVTFETSSGILLERIAKGESVHRVRSLHELKRRLHDGRRCFGLFHNALPDDPLVFIHVGLTTELSPSLR